MMVLLSSSIHLLLAKFTDKQPTKTCQTLGLQLVKAQRAVHCAILRWLMDEVVAQ
jgi:hypothetical protein